MNSNTGDSEIRSIVTKLSYLNNRQLKIVDNLLEEIIGNTKQSVEGTVVSNYNSIKHISCNSVGLTVGDTVQLTTVGRVGRSGDTGKVEALHSKLVSVRLNRKGIVAKRAAKNLFFLHE